MIIIGSKSGSMFTIIYKKLSVILQEESYTIGLISIQIEK